MLILFYNSLYTKKILFLSPKCSFISVLDVQNSKLILFDINIGEIKIIDDAANASTINAAMGFHIFSCCCYYLVLIEKKKMMYYNIHENVLVK